MNEQTKLVRKAAIISLIGLALIPLGLFLYQIVWTLTLMNLVEKPLPESQEAVPDLGIVD